MNYENEIKVVETDPALDGTQHRDENGTTDAQKGAQLGGVGGAITGAAAGAMVGPVGAVIGAVVGGVAGAVASGAAVHQIDKVDDDTTVTGIGDAGRDYRPEEGRDHFVTSTDMRTPETAYDNRNVDGSVVSGTDMRPGNNDPRSYAVTGSDMRTPGTISGTPIPNDRTVTGVDVVPGNNVPGIQTGGTNADGSPDTRGITEKVADAVTGDRTDDKTGKPTV